MLAKIDSKWANLKLEGSLIIRPFTEEEMQPDQRTFLPYTADDIKLFKRSPDLSDEEYFRILEFVQLKRAAFAFDGDKLGAITGMAAHINTDDNEPCNIRPFRFQGAEAQMVQDFIDKNVELGVFSPGFLPKNSPVFLVNKLNGEKRMVIDLRGLNARTICMDYPIPNCDDILNTGGPAKWFASADLWSGFYQIELHPDSKEKTRFTGRYGIFIHNRLPMGWVNSPAVFQRAVEHILGDLKGRYAFNYI